MVSLADWSACRDSAQGTEGALGLPSPAGAEGSLLDHSEITLINEAVLGVRVTAVSPFSKLGSLGSH